jgi:general L-amino acid transport system permease protein
MAAAGSDASLGARAGALWRGRRARAWLAQLFVLGLVVVALGYFADNAADNLQRQGIASGFGFLSREASFEIGTTLIPFSPADTYARAFLVGLLNTILVAVLGIILATLLGFAVGLARLSSNWLIARLALAYVEIMRNTPLLLQLFVWWDLLRVSAPSPRQAWHPLPGVFISNRGINVPMIDAQPLYAWVGIAALGGIALAWLVTRWRKRGGVAATGAGWIALALIVVPPLAVFLAGGAPLALDVPSLAGFNFRGGISLTPELAALLLGLVVYTAAFIGEIVRGGIESVARGQVEAARALGLRRGQALRLVVLPQAVRAMIPPLTSEYLNLTKNSSLAVAIGFPDLVSIGNTAMNQTGQSIECFLLIAAAYEVLNLATSLVMNLYNRRSALVGR